MHLSIVLLWICCIPHVFSTKPTVESILNKNNYQFETHRVVTSDGHILQLHRILPRYRRFPQAPVVFLQHGLFASSSTWIVQDPSHGLGYLLADAGFDVWMGNSRGNLYSNKHTFYPPESSHTWAFSWQDMADFDLDASIDYALAHSEDQKSLYYVGHSQGTLIMFSKLASDPTFGRKIRKFFALAPVGTVGHIKGPFNLFKDISETFKLPKMFSTIKFCGFLSTPFAGQHKFSYAVSKVACSIFDHKICDFLLKVTGGYSYDQINKTQLPYMLHDYPAGTSLRNIAHWLLMRNTGRHARMDSKCTRLVNEGFDLSRIRTDMHLYWSPSDRLANKDDIESYLLAKLPRGFVKEKRLDNFAHQDFVWGTRAAEEIYHPIIRTIEATLQQPRSFFNYRNLLSSW